MDADDMRVWLHARILYETEQIGEGKQALDALIEDGIEDLEALEAIFETYRDTYLTIGRAEGLNEALEYLEDDQTYTDAE